MNLTITEGMRGVFRPSMECFDWCAIQHVSHSNNLELNTMLFPLFTYIFIQLYFSSKEIKFIQPYKDTFLYIAKLLILLFFAVYILHIRLGIGYLAGG